MSQHTFDHNELTILAGWDRPMNEIFMVVVETESDDIMYHNLNDPKASGAQDTEIFKDKLKEMEIPAPEGFWESIEFDRLNDTGNVHTPWD